VTLKTGARVLFDRETEREALYTAKLMKRLTPEYQRYVRMLAEEFLHQQLLIVEADKSHENSRTEDGGS
jgi:hypothetical protein